MKLVKWDASFSQLIEDYQLTEEQLKFVKSPQVNREEAKSFPSRQLIFGLNDEGTAVVFFVLDTDSEYKEQFGVENGIYIRSFSTDTRYVRQGYAKSALQALPDFLANDYSDVEYITLIVDEPNDSAKEMYLKQGFELGELVQGPRYLGYTMIKKIKNEN